MGKTEFFSTARYRTNSVSKIRNSSLTQVISPRAGVKSCEFNAFVVQKIIYLYPKIHDFFTADQVTLISKADGAKMTSVYAN